MSYHLMFHIHSVMSILTKVTYLLRIPIIQLYVSYHISVPISVTLRTSSSVHLDASISCHTSLCMHICTPSHRDIITYLSVYSYLYTHPYEYHIIPVCVLISKHNWTRFYYHCNHTINAINTVHTCQRVLHYRSSHDLQGILEIHVLYTQSYKHHIIPVCVPIVVHPVVWISWHTYLCTLTCTPSCMDIMTYLSLYSYLYTQPYEHHIIPICGITCTPNRINIISYLSVYSYLNRTIVPNNSSGYSP